MDMRPIVQCIRSFILCGWYLMEAQNIQHAPFCYTLYRYNTPHKPGISAIPAGLNKLLQSGVLENPTAAQPCLLLALQCHVFVVRTICYPAWISCRCFCSLLRLLIVFIIQLWVFGFR